MHQSLCSQVTESLTTFDSQLDDLQNKVAALQAIEVIRKAMDENVNGSTSSRYGRFEVASGSQFCL